MRALAKACLTVPIWEILNQLYLMEVSAARQLREHEFCSLDFHLFSLAMLVAADLMLCSACTSLQQITYCCFPLCTNTRGVWE